MVVRCAGISFAYVTRAEQTDQPKDGQTDRPRTSHAVSSYLYAGTNNLESTHLI